MVSYRSPLLIGETMTKEERRDYNRRYYQAHKAERSAKERERRMLYRIDDGTRYSVQRQVNSHGYYRADNIKRAYDERRKQDTTAESDGPTTAEA